MPEDDKVAMMKGDWKPLDEDEGYVAPDEKFEQEQAKKKFCPVIQRLCLRDECVAFTDSGISPYCKTIGIHLPVLSKDKEDKPA